VEDQQRREFNLGKDFGSTTSLPDRRPDEVQQTATPPTPRPRLLGGSACPRRETLPATLSGWRVGVRSVFEGLPSRWIAVRRWLLAITILLAVLATSTLLRTHRRASDLLELVHYNDVFDAAQMQAELLRLDAELGRFALAPSPEGADLVRLRFDILTNHTEMFKHAAVTREMEVAAPGLSGALDVAMARVGAVTDRLATASDAGLALAVLTPLERSLAQATALIGEQSGTSVTRAGDALQSVRDTLFVLVAGLLTAAFALAGVLWHQHAGMRRLAYRDALTGLPNRLGFNMALQASCRREATALLLADVDHFKDINDSFGHDVGDALLVQLATRIAAAVPEVPVVARIGGDEFALLRPAPTTPGEAVAIADRVCAVAAEPFRIGELLIRSGVSVGTVADGTAHREPVTLLKRADLALYTAKAAGRGRQHLFDVEIERGFAARREMEEDLRAAVAEDAIDVHYQPQISLATGLPIGCEALARWEHPRHGRVSPVDFIPLAERSILIVALGHRVLARACAEAATWPGGLRVAVNVSAQQLLESDFAERVTAVLAETGLEPGRLELEITESVLLKINADVLEAIRALRRIGVTFALDDFGTGYSSLSRLHHLPLDKLKIDQSFTRSMEDSGEARGIVATIIDLACKLGLATTAEGVETPSQNAMLRDAGCEQGQGYLYARPMDAQACRRMLDGASPAGPVPPGLAQVA
jgi:diguanylate cyclase (GGDEF)-like protein